MRIGDWVIIHGTTTVYDDREGRIVALDGSNCYVMSNGTNSKVAKKFLRIIKKDINYGELLNQALHPFDKEWVEEIIGKMKEVKP